MATTLNDYLNIMIAMGTLSGIMGAGVWRLRSWIRSDNRNTIREELSPFAATQRAHDEDLAELKVWRPQVDSNLQNHAEQIAYLRGKEDAKAEIANLTGAAGRVVEAITHEHET